MTEFPKPIQLTPSGYKFTKTQEQWFRDNYGTHTKAEMAECAGISEPTMRRIVRKLKLQRTGEQQALIDKRKQERIENSKAWLYASMRGKPMPKYFVEGQKKYISKHRNWFKEATEERKKEVIKLMVQGQKKALERDKKRLRLGMKTLSYQLKENPYTDKQRYVRKIAISKNYIVGDCNGDEYERHSIFYDSETERSGIFEKTAIKRGFFVRPA